MAKKKIKKPVNKRVKKTDAPAPKKPRTRKPKSVITNEPAINTVWRSGSVSEFLGDVGADAATNQVDTPAIPVVEAPNVSVPSRTDYLDDFEPTTWTSAIKEFAQDTCKQVDDFTDSQIEKLKDFAFNHPLLFSISFCVVLSAVAVAVAAAMRYLRW